MIQYGYIMRYPLGYIWEYMGYIKNIFNKNTSFGCVWTWVVAFRHHHFDRDNGFFHKGWNGVPRFQTKLTCLSCPYIVVHRPDSWWHLKPPSTLGLLKGNQCDQASTPQQGMSCTLTKLPSVNLIWQRNMFLLHRWFTHCLPSNCHSSKDYPKFRMAPHLSHFKDLWPRCGPRNLPISTGSFQEDT